MCECVSEKGIERVGGIGREKRVRVERGLVGSNYRVAKIHRMP